jgi:hypothetical protein
MQATYSNPVLTSVRYMQHLRDQQQAYRTDQLVPQSSLQVPNPLQRSSPINMVRTPSSNTTLNSTPLQNPEVFQSFHRTASNIKIDILPYISSNNSLGSIASTPPMAMSYESPKLNRHHHSKRHSSVDNHHRRLRLNSGSSCYESDSPVLLTDDEDKFQVKIESNIFKALFTRQAKYSYESENLYFILFFRIDLVFIDMQHF